MGRHVFLSSLLLAAASCQRTPPSLGEPMVSVPTASGPPGAAQQAGPPRRKPPQLPRSEWRDGVEVTAVGRVSDMPWQHVMGAVPGKTAEYFDLAPDDQTVIYVAGKLECSGQLEVEGRVKEVSAGSKRPSKTGPQRITEMHIDVTRHRCLP